MLVRLSACLAIVSSCMTSILGELGKNDRTGLLSSVHLCDSIYHCISSGAITTRLTSGIQATQSLHHGWLLCHTMSKDVHEDSKLPESPWPIE